MGKYLRARVLLNVTKPLVRGKMITNANGVRKLIKFQYERMPDFCYICGMLDHQESDCPTAITYIKEGCKLEKAFEPWLRAESANFMSSIMHVKGSKPSYSQPRCMSGNSSS
ncbi:hypothetical protein PTKIN_Ptkin04bG0101000 [Pterospermum kingtungense]